MISSEIGTLLLAINIAIMIGGIWAIAGMGAALGCPFCRGVLFMRRRK